jgi:hypothetical protein
MMANSETPDDEVSKLLAEFDEDDADSVSDGSTTHREISLYRSLPRARSTIDPLRWWAEQENSFPTLSKMARKYLCVPATSVPSERDFSSAGNIVTCKRNSLKPSKVNELCFLACNLKKIDKSQ